MESIHAQASGQGKTQFSVDSFCGKRGQGEKIDRLAGGRPEVCKIWPRLRCPLPATTPANWLWIRYGGHALALDPRQLAIPGCCAALALLESPGVSPRSITFFPVSFLVNRGTA